MTSTTTDVARAIARDVNAGHHQFDGRHEMTFVGQCDARMLTAQRMAEDAGFRLVGTRAGSNWETLIFAASSRP